MTNFKFTPSKPLSPETMRKIMLDQPTGEWTVKIGGCKWCGDNNHHAYIDGACWKCWRSRNPGALA